MKRTTCRISGLKFNLVAVIGVSDLSVLKTTQSGYEGYLQDKYTLLPETKERMMATTVTSTWKCAPTHRQSKSQLLTSRTTISIHYWLISKAS